MKPQNGTALFLVHLGLGVVLSKSSSFIFIKFKLYFSGTSRSSQEKTTDSNGCLDFL